MLFAIDMQVTLRDWPLVTLRDWPTATLKAIDMQVTLRDRIPDSRFPIPDSRFPIPDSRFPIPDSRFPKINAPCKIVYQPDNPLDCGARLWIETLAFGHAVRTVIFTLLVVVFRLIAKLVKGFYRILFDKILYDDAYCYKHIVEDTC